MFRENGYYDVPKESPAGGLCGGLCGRVVREVVRGTLGGCAGRLGVFLVGCALRLVHSFLHVSENLAAQAISHSITPPFQNNANPLNSIPFQ